MQHTTCTANNIQYNLLFSFPLLFLVLIFFSSAVFIGLIEAKKKKKEKDPQ